jgi:DNA anti-recombination protein RmuC
MKEGYFQKKLTEIAEKQQDLSKALQLYESDINRLESRIGGLKPVIKRLNDIELFKEKSLDELKKENEKKINRVQDELGENVSKQVKNLIRKKSEILEKSINQINQDAALFKKYATSISSIESEILYVKEFHRLLVMKLVNKGILSYHEQQEIDRRASKKVKKEK